ncbi:MAG: diadenylate cyclase CdaA [Clostridia bacterium]|nr:diadenylate cyclase CdaA [Clostridia bacterium]
MFFQTIANQVGGLFSNLFVHPDWRNIVDVAILTVLIYNVLKLVRYTRASSLFKGIVFILVLAILSDALEIHALNWILQQVISVGVIVICIVFQPELRRLLEQLGRSKLARRVFEPANRHRNTQMERHVTEIVKALNDMSRKKIGALIVLERSTKLGDIIESGTVVDAEISSQLIENIFEPNTPLHDGAMIIRDERITAAACILQLSDDYSISRELGTRHRAAIGITETTDAVSLIVSEETGVISMAREGKLTRYLDTKSLTILLTELFTPERTLSTWISEAPFRQGKEPDHE